VSDLESDTLLNKTAERKTADVRLKLRLTATTNRRKRGILTAFRLRVLERAAVLLRAGCRKSKSDSLLVADRAAFGFQVGTAVRRYCTSGGLTLGREAALVVTYRRARYRGGVALKIRTDIADA